MLSKKSPQKICGIRNWNERIKAHGFLNHHCASTLALESMLLRAPIKNTFSTASVKPGKARIEQFRSALGLLAAVLVKRCERQGRAISSHPCSSVLMDSIKAACEVKRNKIVFADALQDQKHGRG